MTDSAKPAALHPSPAGSFADPGPWHRPANYWFWHRLPTHEEIRSQLQQMASAGYGTFLVTVRMSWPLNDYLSPAYLAAVREAAEQAQRLGLIMGIYDEYNWISGHAGGRTVANRDELREHHLFWTSGVLDAGSGCARITGIRATDADALLDQGRHWIFDGGEAKWSHWEVQSVTAWGPDGSPVDITDAARLVRPDRDGAELEVHAGLEDGSRFVAHVSARSASSRLINYLLPEAAERFVTVGLAPYADALEPYLGSTVRFAFFDQPHGGFYDWAERDGHVGSSLMYSDRLREMVDARAPGGWRRALAAVTHGSGAADDAARADFFELYGETAIDSFFTPVREWCHDHNLLLSGHEVLGHVGGWNPAGRSIADDIRTNFAADYFRIDSHRDITGVDARNNDPQLPAKLGDSVARRHGRSRCIVEQYYTSTAPDTHFAAGQWNLTLSGMRLQTHRHLLLGARQVLQHAFYLTDGRAGDDVFTNPRFDFPPGMNFEPWFDQHRGFADEAARLSAFLDRFEPFTDVALIYPRRSILAHGPDAQCTEHFAAWARAMSERGIEYRVVTESDVAAATVENGQLRCADALYRWLVAPSIAAIDSALADALERCAPSVSVVGSGLPIAVDESGEQRDLRDLARWWAPDSRPPTADEISTTLVVPPERLMLTPLADDARATWMRSGIDADGHTCIAAMNDSDEPMELVLRSPPGPAAIRVWDLTTGETAEKEERHNFVLSMAPQQTVALDYCRIPVERIQLADGWQTSFSPTDDRVSYERIVDLPVGRWELILDEVDVTVDVSVDGTLIGQRAWPPYRFPLDSSGRWLTLRLVVRRSSAERYYAGSTLRGATADVPSGLRGTPVLERLP